ncbi:phenylalanine ammonia-lyase, putative [Talaromyces stipitatus ATCC 10500]|uniref:Phenylalanine ammonia-lyase, putative n=1 Tax=Talaromyces stipitatus (strain ATCC 10500 / CBS 375.48 / QM 6759 / NRRL 1006) TaxID=441959 RepID=B8M8T7_TALSN|nr:phenylalanine ammonia-lyase, putative [Talaromyces stipitatus ATCC 10500]EED20600.1 phenylalanine ammonia-lyase, putative [Talaromyces stipitatus ATCC 10500]
MPNTRSHLDVVHEFWKVLRERTKEGTYELDGDHLHIAEVVATAQRDSIPKLSQEPKLSKALQDSVNVLFSHLEQGWYVYGVNTGFGGSADSRTTEVIDLQKSLMQHTQSGILSFSDPEKLPGHSMPPAWVRAAMVVRCNATLRGHSAVSFPTIKAMANLLEYNLTPVVPLRGSVSASGDLMPLSYVAGSLEGNPDVLLENNDRVLPSHLALQEAGLHPIALGPKEGLSLINGTSSSAGLGALVIGDAHLLALLTQVLTAGAVEALRGSSESFHPFIARCRPHPGQIECSRNIFYFLRGSYLSRDVLEPKNRRREDLVQDRYSLRSAPQWIGPQLEDLLLADQQIHIELNSSCDNPLVDTEANDIYYGCNFQAASVTSAMEKVRLALQMFGRILFSQSTEMIDPHLSGGLPANLAADNPSLSFTMKGVDVNMAAYMAELSYLANPMSSHVQAAEMHNQSVNSMALASARMSFEAVEILKKMCACSVFVVCQALDLRSLHIKFVDEAVKVIASVTASLFPSGEEIQDLDSLQRALKEHVGPAWLSTGKLDLHVRCSLLVSSAISLVVSHAKGPVANLVHWQTQATKAISDLWDETFEAFRAAPHTPSLLGKGSRILYDFVRNTLKVPFHEGFVEHPTIHNNIHGNRPKKTIGGWISIIHARIEDRSIYDGIIPLVEEGLLCTGTNGA